MILKAKYQRTEILERCPFTGQLLKGSYLRSSRNTKGNPNHHKRIPEKDKPKVQSALKLIREQVFDSLLAKMPGDERTLARRVLEETLATKPDVVLKYLERFAIASLEDDKAPEQQPTIHINMAAADNVQING